MTPSNPFASIDFNGFRRFAEDPALSKYERIGFPDSYRKGHEQAIFADICRKVPVLEQDNRQVLDIGPGCSDLPAMLIALCQEKRSHLCLVDSQEMLDLLPDGDGIGKFAFQFPGDERFIEANRERFNAILCYSVLHYIVPEVPFFRFVDSLLALLAPGGYALIGDIPNASKRRRFFSSAAGVAFHQEFMHTSDTPEVAFNRIEHDSIDDSVVFALLQRARAAGFDAYVLPQDCALPMANRREDALFVRP